MSWGVPQLNYVSYDHCKKWILVKVKSNMLLILIAHVHTQAAMYSPVCVLPALMICTYPLFDWVDNCWILQYQSLTVVFYYLCKNCKNLAFICWTDFCFMNDRDVWCFPCPDLTYPWVQLAWQGWHSLLASAYLKMKLLAPWRPSGHFSTQLGPSLKWRHFSQCSGPYEELEKTCFVMFSFQ